MLICGFVEKMKIARMCLLRMAVTMLGLLLSVLLLAFPASGLVIQSKVCEDQFAHVNLNGQELFYVNEDSVEEALFCDAIRAYYANGCTSESYIGCIYCGSVLPPVYIPFKTGRKLMQKELTNGFTFHHGKDKDTSDSKSMTKKVAIAAGGAFLVCCVFLFPCFYKRRKESAPNVIAKESSSMHNSASSFGKNHAVEKIPGSPLRVPPSPRYSNSPKLSRLGSVHLNLSQIMRATQNFSKSQLIGEGGFGSIYKARLADGQVVSIKRAKKELFEDLQTEFSSEVELLAKIDHRNLVKLLGYVDEGNERLIITEYIVNGNLREHLDGLLGKTLEFNQRLEIAIDVAHALTYLHLYAEKPIIHRDVKSSNILLTESMRAKVADFGFARLGPMGDDTDRTHISTKVKGTVGYLDPEYMKTYQLTAKSDVYSFGVVLIEIMTGRRPVELKKPAEERVTLRWAFKLLNEGRMMELIDPAIEETVDAEVLMKIFDLAIQCAAPVRADRPDMKTVGEQLWTIRADYIKSLKSVVVSQNDISI